MSCVAFGATPLRAVMVKLSRRSLSASGVPLKVAVPSVLSTKDSQLGCAPIRVNDGVGVPVAVIVKVPAVPTMNEPVAALVMTGACGTAGASCTVMVKVCIAFGIG